MNEELNNLIDDILKEKLKLHYENEELEAQGKLIKELCKEIERLNNIINELEKWLKECYDEPCFEEYDYAANDTLQMILYKIEALKIRTKR